ncbi:ATP-binding protein [Actinomadura syzygii]|uniref:ATP-binding protein n=1 Tax=Actinomadura syzygii TaxID=1427538 RepID=A0A5D0UFY2_9ACTN|nr:ATP-binding protein [Actinomadura syzygii]TYC16562.1 ATP-binding protein [Actinomadura syzygii]
MNTTGTGTRPPTNDTGTDTTGETTFDDTNGDNFDSDLDDNFDDDLDSDLSGDQLSRSIGRDTGGSSSPGGGVHGEPRGAPGGGYGVGSEAGGDGRAAGERTWELSPGADAASRARALTRHALREWHVTGPADADDIILIVDELVTNAVVHGDGPVRLTLRLDDPLDGSPGRRRLTGDVHDDGARTPAEAPAPPTGAQPPDWSEAGRGLLLVAALATAHGTRPDPADRTGKPGKTVWFTRLLAPATHNPA